MCVCVIWGMPIFDVIMLVLVEIGVIGHAEKTSLGGILFEEGVVPKKGIYGADQSDLSKVGGAYFLIGCLKRNQPIR